MSARDARLLVAHVVYRFDVGGLENGVVNLLNRLPTERFRHAVIALTEVTDFRRRVQRDDVQYFALNKRPGHGAKLWPALYRAVPRAATGHRPHAQPRAARGLRTGVARRRAGARAWRTRLGRRRPRRLESGVTASRGASTGLSLRTTSRSHATSRTTCGSRSVSRPHESRRSTTVSICSASRHRR